MKQPLRKRLLSMRKSLELQWKEKADEKIHAKLFRLPIFRRAKIIFLYVSKRDEVDTHNILSFLIKKKKVIVTPRVERKKLILHSIENFEHLEQGKFDIYEPKKTRPKVNPKTIQLALVPGIAFDRNGHRIGYGHGYFDRLLKKMGCQKIGLAYDFQMVDNIKTHQYDVPVDFIITEKQLYKIPLRKGRYGRVTSPRAPGNAQRRQDPHERQRGMIAYVPFSPKN